MTRINDTTQRIMIINGKQQGCIIKSSLRQIRLATTVTRQMRTQIKMESHERIEISREVSDKSAGVKVVFALFNQPLSKADELYIQQNWDKIPKLNPK